MMQIRIHADLNGSMQNDADRSIFSFVRHSKDGKSNLLFVINFTPVARPDYRVGVPKKKTVSPRAGWRCSRIWRKYNGASGCIQGSEE